MKAVARIGLDIAKNTFQVHGVNAHGAVVMRKQLSAGRCLGSLLMCRPVWSASKPVLVRITGRESSRGLDTMRA